MADEDARSIRDIEFARMLGEEAADSALSFWRSRFSFSHRTVELLEFMLNRLRIEDDTDLSLDTAQKLQFIGDLNWAASVLELYDVAGTFSALVFTKVENAYDAYPLIDLFNARARSSIANGGFKSADIDAPREFYSALRAWIRQVSEGSSARSAPTFRALRDFFTLFIDSIRAAARSRQFSSQPAVSFTLHASNSGYQVEYYHQYKFSPVVFGSTLTTPVTGILQVGHYHFQGWKSSQLVQDPGVYFAGPSSTSAHVRTF